MDLVRLRRLIEEKIRKDKRELLRVGLLLKLIDLEEAAALLKDIRQGEGRATP
jgi:hypothetical protein